MPYIRPISDLENNSYEISEFCRNSREPVFITKNGVGDMVVLSMEMYEHQQAQLELYEKLAEAEARTAAGEESKDFNEVADKIRAKLIKKLHGEV